MNREKGWIIGLLSIVLVVAYACEDDTYNAVNSEQNQAVGPEQIEGQPPSSAGHVQRNFRAHLEGGNEVPAVETDARGQATFKVSKDGSSIHYKLIAANIENVLMAHIHKAPAGQNGGIEVWLYPASPSPQLIEGRFQGVLAEGEITADDLLGTLGTLDELVEEMKAGNTYVNVHTSQNRAGEIRGQIH